MRQFAVLVIAITTASLALSGTASAHVLKVDGNISAVLHINPDDNPISGTPTAYALYFNDDTGRFSLSECNCTVTVKNGSQTVAAHSLRDTSRLQSNNTFTFPKPGAYILTIQGKPKKSDAFQPFEIIYLERVASRQNSITTQTFPPILGIGLGLGICLILLGAYKQNYDYNKRRGNKKNT